MIVECEVIAEVHGCRNLGNVVGSAGAEMEATCSVEQIHMDFLLVEDFHLQEVDLEISPFDLVLWNLEGSLSSGSGQWGFAGAELVNTLEQPACVAASVEISLTAEHCSVTYVETAVPVLMEVHRWYQLVEAQYLTEVLHEVASNGGPDIHCFGLAVN